MSQEPFLFLRTIVLYHICGIRSMKRHNIQCLNCKQTLRYHYIQWLGQAHHKCLVVPADCRKFSKSLAELTCETTAPLFAYRSAMESPCPHSSRGSGFRTKKLDARLESHSTSSTLEQFLLFRQSPSITIVVSLLMIHSALSLCISDVAIHHKSNQIPYVIGHCYFPPKKKRPPNGSLLM